MHFMWSLIDIIHCRSAYLSYYNTQMDSPARAQGSHKCNSKNPYNSTKTFQKILKSVVVQHIGAGKILGVRMIFALILLTCPKKSIKSDLQKKFFVFFWLPLGAIFAHIFRHLLRFSWILWRFSEISPRFPRIFPGFSPNQNCSFAPPPPTPVAQHKIGALW